MSNILETKEKVQRHLSEFVGGLELLPDGRLAFEYQSTKLVVAVNGNDSGTWAIFTAPVGFEVPTSPELFKWIALNTGNYLFGHLECLVQSEDDPTATIIFSHTLLADYLDAEELRRAVTAVVTTADDLDDDVVARFGGKRYADT